MAKKKSRKKARLRRKAALAAAIIAALAALVLYFVFKPSYRLKNEDDPVATITLTGGKKIIVELFPDKAPETVGNFIYLADGGFYDGLTFHRIIEGERIQAGDKFGDGGGDAGYFIRGEFELNGFQNDISHLKGALSMARTTSYDSASSQFFICLDDLPYLDGAYAAFGSVVYGLDELEKISKVQTDENHIPLSDITIKSIRVDTKDKEYPFTKIGG